MPEMLEIELYRRSVLDTVGHIIDAVEALDDWWCRRAPDVAERVVGCRVVDLRRHGKVLLVDTDGPTIGVRFGMTGRLLVDGRSGVESLAYGAHADDGRWRRLRMLTTGGGRTVRWDVSDPRRLGSVEIDPDLSSLGPDAWGIPVETLAERLARRQAPIKAALLDQAVLAGLGNMLADEMLWRAAIAPDRPARSLATDEVAALAGAIGVALPEMLTAGGSHAGRLHARLRSVGMLCPLDDGTLVRSTIAGRSSYWCPRHQR
jgi:formamidopyrimidine-DNA glycosylase